MRPGRRSSVSGMTADPRPCTPEWCESGTEPHDEVCDNAPMGPMTKREFVEYLTTAAKHGIEAFRLLMTEPDDVPIPDGPDFTDEDKVEMAVVEVEESATCYAGIGSCGRGWCKHS
jgi:hypothetical protein